LIIRNNNAEMPHKIDHIIYVAPLLEEGIHNIERLLGVKAVIGGRHLSYGTHNALLSLGNHTYLEIVAPDPESSLEENKLWLKNKFIMDAHLATWVLQADDIQGLHKHALSQGIKLGAISSGERVKTDGSILKWTLSDPNAMPYSGALPFLINWGKTIHPAKTTPSAGTLKKLMIIHPQAQKLRELMKLLNCPVEVQQGSAYILKAFIESKNGLVILE